MWNDTDVFVMRCFDSLYAFIKDITNLAKLPNLVELGLKNNLYETNPIGLLCNYSTHLLYHMPNLTSLDTYDVTSKTLRDMVEVCNITKH